MEKQSPLQRWCNTWIATGAIDREQWVPELLRRKDRDRWLADAMEIVAEDHAVGPKFSTLSVQNKTKVLVSIAAGLVFGDLRLDCG